jgi:hypothetical protein
MENPSVMPSIIGPSVKYNSKLVLANTEYLAQSVNIAKIPVAVLPINNSITDSAIAIVSLLNIVEIINAIAVNIRMETELAK